MKFILVVMYRSLFTHSWQRFKIYTKQCILWHSCATAQTKTKFAQDKEQLS